jgi:hypothetical protein
MLTSDLHLRIIYVLVALFLNCVIASPSFAQSDRPPEQTDTAPSEPASAGSEQKVPEVEKPREVAATEPANKASLLEASGLVFQVPYVLVKFGVAMVGSIASGITWIATAGNDEPAKTIWSSTTSGPWSWPDWLTQQRERMFPSSQ